ncbi:MFS transporter [Agromyces mediolanus]|uniref:MFS transporter n=1 Tax=Agromyces mediolanus TaxID=41986 RepID=A0A918CDE4_AGRME|nr:MFS transporter [Agromyces mediolanus]GGR18663.1 MFS transporter [Agromyces mediolanus]GLJ71412.1 MFS transporter [Agromyces mediolanus]
MTALTRRSRIGYALGGIASGTYGTVPGLILMPFLTDLLGVEAAVAGMIVFAPKAWDFFLNPVAGRISDRSRHPHDRRRPFVLRAGILLALAFAAMFFGPTAPPLAGALWVLALFLASATVYAFFQVPYLAMSAEITDDYSERTRLIAWRVVVFSLAILVSGATAPALVELAGGVAGYRLMAGAMAVLILVGTIGVWWGTRRVPLTREEVAGGRLFGQLAEVLRDRDARNLIVAYVLQAVAIGMVLGGVVYVARHVVHDPGVATIAFVCFVAPAIVLTPAWSRLGRAIGKQRGFAVATGVLTVGLIALLAARSGDVTVLLVAAGVVGVGYAGTQLFPLAMLPDLAAEDAKRSGTNRIGMISGVWSGFELLGYALGPAILGLVLSLGGYRASAGDVVAQSGEAQWAIVLGVSAIPALLCAVSLVPLSRYRLDARLRRAAAADAAPRAAG